MTWKIAVIFILGTIVSSVVANFRNFSTQVGVISYVLIIISKKDIGYIELIFSVFVVCIIEDTIDGTVLGMNFITFIIPILIDKVILNITKKNFFTDAFIFSFTVILSTILRSFIGNLFSIPIPNTMNVYEWLSHNIAPIAAIYILIYFFYSYLNRSRLAI